MRQFSVYVNNTAGGQEQEQEREEEEEEADRERESHESDITRAVSRRKLGNAE